MKFNWGHGIAVFIVTFVVMLGLFAYNIMQIQFDLVDENYYQMELAHEDHINSVHNANTDFPLPDVVLSENQVLIAFNDAYKGSSGEVHFYDPVSKDNDRKVKFDLTKDNVCAVPTASLPSNYYHVRIAWTNNGKSYFHETELQR